MDESVKESEFLDAGGGEGEEHIRGELRDLGLAIRRGWVIPPETLQALSKRYDALIANPKTRDRVLISLGRLFAEVIRANTEAIRPAPLSLTQVNVGGAQPVLSADDQRTLASAYRLLTPSLRTANGD